ncbi:MAG: FAD-binding oxidoreductase [Pseudomonadota bacterium]
MTIDPLFSADFKSEPYWWDRTPRPRTDERDVPASVDVAIVGSGYTGLNAAITTARSGRQTVVFDAEDAGFGCSTRNGGQISTSIKPGLKELTRRYGEETARGLIKEGQSALSWIERFLAQENIDCDFKVTGRFHAAHTPRAFDKMTQAVRDQPKGLEVPYQIVERADQHQQIGTQMYHGGVVFENHASLDPGRYHQALFRLAESAGVQIVSRCRVIRITRSGSEFSLRTEKGEVRARDLIIATNGYTSELTPRLRRRVLPIGSYVIATDLIAQELMDRLMPSDRIVSDSRKVVYYYRPSPDRKRIIFGGRVSSAETDTKISARRLKHDLDALFPDLQDTKISHSWMGFVAYTFDTLANVGKRDGMYYAMGYCGSGVSMASYLGMKIGHQVLGERMGDTAFGDIPMSTRPLYRGKPWFLPAAVAWYRFMDRINL